MNTEDAHRLRPYYQPRDDLSFVATAPMLNSAPAHAAETASAPARGSDSFPLTTLPSSSSTNRYLSSDADLAGLGGSDRLTPGAFAKGMAVSAALQFTSNFLAMPFEVGKLLLQVQWVPSQNTWDRLNVSSKDRTSVGENDDDKEAHPWSTRDAWQEQSDDDEDMGADQYFRDESGSPVERPRTQLKKAHSTDQGGYMTRSNIHDDETRPEYVMPIVVKGGVWEMIKSVIRSKEGWTSLWKGTLTTFLLDISTNTIQPIITGFLSLFTPTALNAMPIAFSPTPFTALGMLTLSHVITGTLVSPLDLVRTRLIAQSTLPSHRKYAGPVDALRTILHEEGGWRTIYLTPLLCIPTILDFTFRSLLTLGAPLFVENTLRLDPNAVPISYALAELAISTLALGITLPIETIRRRLQLQYHPPLRRNQRTNFGQPTSANTARVGLRACVETRPVPYTGFLECMYRIVSEETSVAPSKLSAEDQNGFQMVVSRGFNSIGGLRNLFRGFGMGFSANLLVFVLTLLTGERQGSAGWTEM
ncbi:hypothetical protein MYAM1_000702 [Malassezia yamatoensis]|uniref:Mitochondrial carrier n=1 Tax=Malassezia yamatoensis TaxID=253288 RepID=A0AAJ5YPY9_9BASI|nr:hypothetical protein MYAM1_000702 [Malassezia yamatoensis]